MPLSRERPGLAEYAAHLALLHAWLAPLESWLAGFGDGPQGPEAPPFLRRLPLIDADLAQIAERGETAVTPAAPIAAAWRPEEEGAAFRWGVTYVIEGSQLGGAVLHRQLAERLAPHPLRYLAGSGTDAGARFRQFVGALRLGVVDPLEIAQACSGARAAFDRLIDMLGPAGSTPRSSES